MDMPEGSMDMKDRYAAWTSSMDKQQGHAAFRPKSMKPLFQSNHTNHLQRWNSQCLLNKINDLHFERFEISWV
jgi:hypothetical protein